MFAIVLASALASSPVQLTLAQAQEDFNLLPPEKKPDAATVAKQAELERSLARRREMLQLHQLGGFLTLAGLTLTVAIGQANYSDKYGGGGDTGRFITLHRWTALGTTAVFTATGLLAVFAPVPIEKKVRLDTAMLHKIAMGVATAGMVSQVVLGFVTASKEGSIAQRDYALAHQIIGYTTLAAATAGFTVLTF